MANRPTPLGYLETVGSVSRTGGSPATFSTKGEALVMHRAPSKAPDRDRHRADEPEGDRHADRACLCGKFEIVVVCVVENAGLQRGRLVGSEGIEPRSQPGSKNRKVAENPHPEPIGRDPGREAEVHRAFETHFRHPGVRPPPRGRDRQRKQREEHREHRRQPFPKTEAFRRFDEVARQAGPGHGESEKQGDVATSRIGGPVDSQHDEEPDRDHDWRPETLLVGHQRGDPDPARPHTESAARPRRALDSPAEPCD